MNWAYVAGYFDGEGHVISHEPPSRRGYKITGLLWSNTHRESLVAIQEFMGCGRLRGRQRPDWQRPLHDLIVVRCDDVVRVGTQMLPHLIIKRDAVRVLIEYVRTQRKPAPMSWGKVSAFGVDVIRRMYWEDGLKQSEIAAKIGVHRGAIATFMSRHKIRGRSPGPQPRILTLTDGNA